MIKRHQPTTLRTNPSLVPASASPAINDPDRHRAKVASFRFVGGDELLEELLNEPAGEDPSDCDYEMVCYEDRPQQPQRKEAGPASNSDNDLSGRKQ